MPKLYLWGAVGLLLFWLVFTWSTTTAPSDYDTDLITGIHRLAAHLAIGLLLAQFLLSSRIRIIERRLGQDKMLSYHRWMGRLAVGLLSIHLGLSIAADLLGPGQVTLAPYRIPGAIGLVLIFCAASLASTYRLLGLRYEVFKTVHMLTYAGFPLVLVHVWMQAHTPEQYLLWAALTTAYVLLLVHRLLHIHAVRKNHFTVAEVQQENEDTWSLFFTGCSPEYLPGQFMHLQLLRDGRLSASHPFTISSSPTRDLLSVTAKEVGDFTSTLGHTRPGDRAFIDAPYGVFSFLHAPAGRPLVFLAGGIGITPFMSMLRYMQDQQIDREVLLFWGNRRESNLLFRAELRDIETRISGLKIVLAMSGEPEWPGVKGRLDVDLISRYTSDLTECEYFLCGPPPMTRSLQKGLIDRGVPTAQIHREIFEL